MDFEILGDPVLVVSAVVVIGVVWLAPVFVYIALSRWVF